MVCVALLCACRCFAQGEGAQAYSRKNTFAVFAEYSNDSSRIVLGSTPSRRILGVGAQYERTLHTWDAVRLAYQVELRPMLLERDTQSQLSTTEVISNGNVLTYHYPSALVLRCSPSSSTILEAIPGPPPLTATVTFTTTCSRSTSYAQALAPIGFSLNLLPRHRLQPRISSNGGYILSTRQMPISGAGSFNFSFEFGAGLEYFLRQANRSVRLEYQIQHYSDAHTATYNPGVDSGLFKLTYAFGR